MVSTVAQPRRRSLGAILCDRFSAAGAKSDVSDGQQGESAWFADAGDAEACVTILILDPEISKTERHCVQALRKARVVTSLREVKVAARYDACFTPLGNITGLIECPIRAIG